MKPLCGVTVIDISRLLPGGYASLLLLNLGARVIKVEQPGVGDYYRAVVSESASEGEILGGRQVHILNYGKESLGLDLKSPEGREIFKKLCRKADVILESFRPGALKKLGIGYPVLKKIKPSLILCSITGGGQKGPEASLAGHDLNYLGASGLLMKIRDEGGRPVVPDFQIIDLAAGDEAVRRILAALYQRIWTKKGSWIDVSMMGAGNRLASLYPPRKRQFLAGGFMRYGIYRTADDHYVTLAALEPKFWSRFCRRVGHPEWEGDPLLSSSRDDGKQAEMKEIFRSRTLKEWTEIGLREDCCLFPVHDVADFKPSPMKEFPALGSHTMKILRPLGYSWGQLRSFKVKGVIQ